MFVEQLYKIKEILRKSKFWFDKNVWKNGLGILLNFKKLVNKSLKWKTLYKTLKTLKKIILDKKFTF